MGISAGVALPKIALDQACICGTHPLSREDLLCRSPVVVNIALPPTAIFRLSLVWIDEKNLDISLRYTVLPFAVRVALM